MVVLTDDQRWDTLWAMPNVRRELMARGVTFTNAFVSNPLCCPSRASILTGQYSHSTGMWQNRGRYGGFHRFRDSSTLATWLNAGGYQTALIGKYLNGYDTTYIPPGWNRWVAFADTEDPYDLYYDYLLNIDGRIRRQRTGYSTNFLASQAVRYILTARQPFFLYFTPYAPHTPTEAAPGDRRAFAGLEPYRPPNYDESDVSDKPAWIRNLPRVRGELKRRLDGRRLGALRSLLAVDRAVGAVVQALRVTGRLENTVLIFMSDNGMIWGEHRWRTKAAPYDESIRVPFVLRYDRVIGRPRRDDHLVVNVDIAPTIADIAGVPAPGVEGRSLMPLLRQSGKKGWRSDFPIEYGPSGVIKVPAYCGLRSRRFSYIRYATGEEELYDIVKDPYELSNLAGQPRTQGLLRELHRRLKEECRPPPPGMSL